VNVPGSEITGTRGGIHNSVTRVVLKPTHMIGGYAQLAYGFNYYGTVGTNRDEFVWCARWQGRLARWFRRRCAAAPIADDIEENEMKIRAQIGMVLNLDKCIGCHTCSITCKNVWTSREGVEYAWFNNVETKPGIGYPRNGKTRTSGTAAGCATPTARSPAHRRQVARAGEHLRQPRPAADRRLLRAVRLRLPAPAPRRWASTSRPRVRAR
jgi:NAD-dependent dihydropyrimidine dehydrogenase PreA subunit